MTPKFYKSHKSYESYKSYPFASSPAVAVPKNCATSRHSSKRLRLRDNSEGNGVHQARRVAKRRRLHARVPYSQLLTPYSVLALFPHSSRRTHKSHYSHTSH